MNWGAPSYKLGRGGTLWRPLADRSLEGDTRVTEVKEGLYHL